MEITILDIPILTYIVLAVYTAGLCAGRLKLANEKQRASVTFNITNFDIIWMSLSAGFFWPIVYLWTLFEWLEK